MGLYDSLVGLSTIDINQVLVRGALAVIIIIIGIFLGKIIALGLKTLSRKLELNTNIRGSFIDLFLVVIKWSIYIVFISLGLKQLEIPTLTNFFTNILITIPALTGALILIALGFAIGYYLKKVIQNSEIKQWETISKAIFYFVIYIFGVYALKTALISIDEMTTNWIIIVLTTVFGTAVAYTIVKKTTND